jgi:hypothetical protein
MTINLLKIQIKWTLFILNSKSMLKNSVRLQTRFIAMLASRQHFTLELRKPIVKALFQETPITP